MLLAHSCYWMPFSFAGCFLSSPLLVVLAKLGTYGMNTAVDCDHPKPTGVFLRIWTPRAWASAHILWYLCRWVWIWNGAVRSETRQGTVGVCAQSDDVVKSSKEIAVVQLLQNLDPKATYDSLCRTHKSAVEASWLYDRFTFQTTPRVSSCKIRCAAITWARSALHRSQGLLINEPSRVHAIGIQINHNRWLHTNCKCIAHHAWFACLISIMISCCNEALANFACAKLNMTSHNNQLRLSMITCIMVLSNRSILLWYYDCHFDSTKVRMVHTMHNETNDKICSHLGCIAHIAVNAT